MQHEEEDLGDLDNTDDVQAAHGLDVARRHYDVRSDMLLSLTPFTISTFQNTSEKWHRFPKLPSLIGHNDQVNCAGVNHGYHRQVESLGEADSHDRLVYHFASEDRASGVARYIAGGP